MMLTRKEIKLPDINAYVAELRQIVSSNINQLGLIGALIQPDSMTGDNINELVLKVDCSRTDSNIQFSGFEIETLCFHIKELSEHSISGYFLLQLLPKCWSSSYINGLISSLLLGWRNEYAATIQRMLSKHSSEFSSEQKNASHYFLKDTGPAELGRELKRSYQNILSAPSLVLLPQETFHYVYFDEVIYSFYRPQEQFIHDFQAVREALECHCNPSFSRLFLSHVVIYADSSSKKIEPGYKGESINICEALIGPIGDLKYWQDSSLDEKDKEFIIKAYNILKKWRLNNEIRRVFNAAGSKSYPDREYFWKSYIGRLLIDNQGYTEKEYYRVFSSNNNFSVGINGAKGELLGDDNTAVIMKFKSCMVIEFLDGGCMYLYSNDYKTPSGCELAKYLFQKKSVNTNDLKQDIPRISHSDVMQRTSFPNAVKIAHQGEWQKPFERLLLIKGVQKTRDMCVR